MRTMFKIYILSVALLIIDATGEIIMREFIKDTPSRPAPKKYKNSNIDTNISLNREDVIEIFKSGLPPQRPPPKNLKNFNIDKNKDLNREDVIEIFKSGLSPTSIYLQSLANEFANKAAVYFFNEMKSKERQLTIKAEQKQKLKNRKPVKRETPMTRNRPRPPVKIVEEKPEEDILLNEIEAMELIEDPSPDGDNLALDSPNLSEDETQKFDNTPQQPLKINGKVYRRVYFGFL